MAPRTNPVSLNIHGRHFEVRWGVRTDALLEHVRKSVHSCEQVTLEAEARGENIRCSSKAARKSRRMTRAAEEPALSRRMAQKDASRHAEEKHAPHHDGP